MDDALRKTCPQPYCSHRQFQQRTRIPVAKARGAICGTGTVFKNMIKPSVFLAGVIAAQLINMPPAFGQTGGDQFLDGIGETALAARYLFNGNERDSSRNTLHASLQGTGGTYVDDPQFGRVLSLPGGKGAYRQDSRAGAGRTGHHQRVGLDSTCAPRNPGQQFYNFGQNAASNFFCVPVGGEGQPLGSAGITRNGPAGAQWVTGLPIPTNRWAHVAVVLNAATKTMTWYLDGANSVQATGVNLTLEQVLNQDDGALNRVFIGRSQDDNDPTLNALVHDFRIYSVALTDQQVATIHKNALAGREGDDRGGGCGSNQPATQIAGHRPADGVAVDRRAGRKGGDGGGVSAAAALHGCRACIATMPKGLTSGSSGLRRRTTSRRWPPAPTKSSARFRAPRFKPKATVTVKADAAEAAAAATPIGAVSAGRRRAEPG